ncbi:MAG TPA: catalase [Gammaproteobacteria bacterium]|nr:catalase [Gammaproteobacteria bacterium]
MDISISSPLTSYNAYRPESPATTAESQDEVLPATRDTTPEQTEQEAKTTTESNPGQQFSDSDKRETRELQRRDQEVRAHEAAHKAAAGRYATGGASFDYQRGPDGRQYAIGGEVSIDTSRPEDPSEAQSKAQTIQAAALAPADPSAQDRQVAQAASQMAAEARAELAKQTIETGESAAQYAAVDRTGASEQPNSEPGKLLNEIA